ncbi:T-cell immunoglobulin and mucin domain-containing protein 4-like [Austrofundulus limnaeus]|uniref:T-cell immunoglobulin and mucin domain-containing protein 4-like n=1 Tax=Austrofundulus limnaeus TaxID=52670 RepID=UPI0006B3AA9A|nr:PREDICTED: T-cell immunoglobulin and mucin domain-containing protein 4-like [Austrofundulus limnaeus]
MVILPCQYDTNHHGVAKACWVKGDLPKWGECGSNHLIFTDGHKVTSRTSNRYQLLSQMDKGDVSLTILNLTEEDGGTYSCRVAISGPFNDIKQCISLTVVKGSTTAPPSSTEPKTTATNQSTGPMTTEDILTSSAATNKSPEDPSPQTGILWCVLLLLVVLVSAGGLFIIGEKKNSRT